MGNRAHVIFTDGEGRISPAVYLHWNGGPESVYAFLAELDRRKVRADAHYECARFTQIVGEFFSQGHEDFGAPENAPKVVDNLSLGIANGPAEIAPEALKPFDHGDNGVYVVCRRDELNVRRFAGTWDGPLKEMTARQVASERREAERSEYGPEMAKFYAELYAGVVFEAA